MHGRPETGQGSAFDQLSTCPHSGMPAMGHGGDWFDVRSACTPNHLRSTFQWHAGCTV
jgi:hypothetical protein